MATLIKLNGTMPKIGNNCFLAESAVLIGDVILGDNCSIWYGAVLRGDVNSIRLGNNVNVQDNVVIHSNYKQSVAILDDNVSIGHGAIVHGAHVKAGSLIGMNATLLDDSVVGEGTIVAANTLVASRKVLEPFSVYAGIPAKLLKSLDPNEENPVAARNAKGYQLYASWYQGEGYEVVEVNARGERL